MNRKPIFKGLIFLDIKCIHTFRIFFGIPVAVGKTHFKGIVADGDWFKKDDVLNTISIVNSIHFIIWCHPRFLDETKLKRFFSLNQMKKVVNTS